ncbi:MAG: polysaccharide deacetylase family protein [Eubacteriales bacterium]
MFNGKNKAVTFSYDDGVTQDIRLVELFNKYGLKSTFNINSQLLGMDGALQLGEVKVSHVKVKAEDVRKIYAGHEIAVHTLTHPNLTTLEDGEIIRQVEQDRLALSELAGYEVVGMAYPCGGVNNNDHVAKVIKENTGVRYSRTIDNAESFDPQDYLHRLKPSVYHMEFDKLFELGERFLFLEADKPQIYYIWGHSYELDLSDGWDRFEKFCAMISGKNDIFYGTNAQVLLDCRI